MIKYLTILFFAISSFSTYSMDMQIDSAFNIGSVYHQLILDNIPPKKSDFDFGRNIHPEFLGDYFYDISYDFLPYYSDDLKDLYTFLDCNDLIRTVGYIKLKDLFQANRLSAQRIELKRKLAASIPPGSVFTEKTAAAWVLSKGVATGVFNSYQKGIFFRSKDAHLKKDPKNLYSLNKKAKQLFKKIAEINQHTLKKMEALEALVLSRNPDVEHFNAVLLDENMPKIAAAKLRYLLGLKEYSEITLIDTLKDCLKNDIGVLKERIESLEKIYPSKIDLMLLYCFYLFDNESKSITERTETIKGRQAVSLLSSYTEDESLSPSDILASFAQNILEEIGYFKFKIAEFEPTVTKVSKAKPKKKDALKKKVDTVVKEATIEVDDSINTSWVYATNAYDESSIRIKLNKGHRLLDTFARLIGYELAALGNSAGSVSVAIANELGNDQLIISTKRIVPKWLISQAINNIYHSSTAMLQQYNAREVFIKSLKVQYEETKRISVNFLQYRKPIDLIKFAKALQNNHHSTMIELRFNKIFAQGIEKINLLILPNPFNFHSEINLASYLIKNSKPLDIIQCKERDCFYQYIGGSIHNCGGCSSLFKGSDTIVGLNNKYDIYNMYIFTRGGYDCLYPGYELPRWAIEMNGSRNKTYKALEACTVPVCNKSKYEVIVEQEADLSQSDDEDGGL